MQRQQRTKLSSKKSSKDEWFMGWDPGWGGAFAVVSREGQLIMTVKMADPAIIAVEVLRIKSSIRFALLEQVHSMPKQGVSSTFKFGRGYGIAEGIIAACSIPYQQITPMKWQTIMGCRTKGDKNISKAAAQKLFPGFKITHQTADAVLLAELARRQGLNLRW